MSESNLQLPDFTWVLPDETDKQQQEEFNNDQQNQTKQTEQQEQTEENPIATELFNLLREDGILTLDDQFKFGGSISDIRTAFEYQRQLDRDGIAQQLLSSLPTEFVDIYEAVLEGVSDPVSLLEYKKQELTNYDVSTLESQRFVISTSLKNKGMKDTMIETMIDTLEKNGQLEATAKEVVEELKTEANKKIKQAKEEEKVKREQQAKAEREQQEKFANTFKTELDKLPWTEQRKKVVSEQLFKVDPVSKLNPVDLKLASIINNPQHLIQFADLISYYDPQKGFDLENFTKTNSQLVKDVKNKWESAFSNVGSLTKQPIKRDVNLDNVMLFPNKK